MNAHAQKMIIKTIEEGYPGRLNSDQKAFLRGCSISQLMDPTYTTKGLSYLSADAESRVVFESLKRLDTTTAESARCDIRKLLIKAGTDVELNDSDPYGDGDQTSIQDNEVQHQILRSLFSEGGDLEFSLNEPDQLSAFCWLCVNGDKRGVERALKEATKNQPQQRLRELLEKRWTSMRLPPLLLTVAMSKHKATVNHYSGRNIQDMDHLGVFRVLLKYGARPNAKDVTGKTGMNYELVYFT